MNSLRSSSMSSRKRSSSKWVQAKTFSGQAVSRRLKSGL